MGSNKVATLIVLDVNQSMDIQTDNNETFFERSINCVKSMILRKLFSQDTDEYGILLFGSDDTKNPLAKSGYLYKNISVYSKVTLPSWDLYSKIDSIKTSSRQHCDWVEAVIVAIDFLKSETQGRRFKTLQIIVFSNCVVETTSTTEDISPIVTALEGGKIHFIAVGSDIKQEYSQGVEISKSWRLLLHVVTNISSGVHFSFPEVEEDLKYFEKKRRAARLFKSNLIIGSNVQMPIRWMKVNSEKTRFKWLVPPEVWQNEEAGVSAITGPSSKTVNTEDTVKYTTDMVKYTHFGATLIELSYADIEAMSRKTGAPSLQYLGSVKSSRIPRSMLVGRDVYVIVADRTPSSVSMFYAFVDALIRAKKYGLARRIASKNGKIHLGALLPVSDELGKAMYFLKLPFAEWVKPVPEKHIPEPNEEALKAMSDLIDATMLPDDLVEEGKGLMVRDPTFQSRCHALHLRFIGQLPQDSFIIFPETINKTLYPFTFSADACVALERLHLMFPSQEPLEKNLKEEDSDISQSEADVKDHGLIGDEPEDKLYVGREDLFMDKTQ